ncbi:MAG: hypothetical protein ACKOCF_06560, partial [Gammaproteobacteria bacterium]
GLNGPLPFITDASFAAAKSLAGSPDDPGAAIAKAHGAWVNPPNGWRQSGPAPCDDPYHQLVYGSDLEFGGEFLQLAAAVFMPLLERLEDGGP